MKYLLLPILFILAIAVESCFKCDGASCECEPDIPKPTFSVTGVSSSLGILQNIYQYEVDSVKVGSYYPQDSLVIVVKATDYENIARVKTNRSFNLFTSAYACSPISVAANQLITVSIVNNDTSVIREKDLTPFFEITNFGRNSFYSIRQYEAESFKGIEYGQEWYLKYVGEIKDSLILDFDLTFFMSDGKEFLMENQEMRLKAS